MATDRARKQPNPLTPEQEATIDAILAARKSQQIPEITIEMIEAITEAIRAQPKMTPELEARIKDVAARNPAHKSQQPKLTPEHEAMVEEFLARNRARKEILDRDQARKSQQPKLTPEQQARVEAIRAKNRTPEARAEQAQSRDALGRERRETGTIKTTGDGTTMGELVAFRRFVMAMRRERERLGLSLADVAERAKIDKGALSRLENGQQLNPTVNTLARYVSALGKTLAWGMTDDRS